MALPLPSKSTAKVPKFVTTTRPHDLKPRLSASAPFVFGHHWTNWQVQCGRVVPALSPIKVKPGLNGTKQDREGNLNAAAYFGKKLQQGWTLLQDVYTTQDGEPYLHEVAPGVWLSRWEEAVGGSEIVISDEKGYVEWLLWLVEAGHIQPIKPYVLTALLEKVRQQAGEAGDLAKTSDTMRPRATRLAADLKVLEAEAVTGA